MYTQGTIKTGYLMDIPVAYPRDVRRGCGLFFVRPMDVRAGHPRGWTFGLVADVPRISVVTWAAAIGQ